MILSEARSIDHFWGYHDAVRNLSDPLTNFTTANFDFLQRYWPRMNVVDRRHAGSGGKGCSITGHHELMIPLLARAPRKAEA